MKKKSKKSGFLKVVPNPSPEEKLKNKGFLLIAGIDEAGRGPLAGPVVASAVILNKFKFKAKITDSKLLSPQKRTEAYLEIMDKATVGIGVVGADVIDRINIYRATILAMEQAVKNLKLPPDYLLIDGNIKLSTNIPQESLIKGELQSISIASASIIAKVTRDKIMTIYDRFIPHFGFKKHKGYGTKDHYLALNRIGPSPLHRKSFNLIMEGSGLEKV